MKSLILIFFSVLLPTILFAKPGKSSLLSTSWTSNTDLRDTSGKSGLKSFQGYYQLQNNDLLHMQVLIEGNRLKLIQQWDLKEILFDQKSELEFINSSQNFPVVFLKDSTGIIKSFKAFGRDTWNFKNDYIPEIYKDLTASESKALQIKLNSMAEELANTVNSNSSSDIELFLSKYASESLMNSKEINMVSRLNGVFRSTGGVKFLQNISFNPKISRAEYQYQGAVLNNIFEFMLQLDKDGKIKSFNSRIISDRNAELKIKGEGALIQRLQQAFTALEKKDIFSGTVLIAKENNILFTFACGDANKKFQAKNTINTRFNLGSMNKMFTATSILQLVERKKLNLDDPISKYIDTTWLPRKITEQITVHNLLSHTSGLGDFFTKEFEATPSAQFRSLSGYKPFIKHDTLIFKPGTDWSYSNSGMLLLGVIIEKISGGSYSHYVKKNIYDPAGMRETNMYNVQMDSRDFAIGYIPDSDGDYQSNLNSAYARGSAAGGGYSTVYDLHKFALALTSNKLVSESSKIKLFTDYMNKGYGYGYQIQKSSLGKAVGHSGGAPGINAIQSIFLENGYIVVVLSNYDRAVGPVYDYIMSEIQRTTL